MLVNNRAPVGVWFIATGLSTNATHYRKNRIKHRPSIANSRNCMTSFKSRCTHAARSHTTRGRTKVWKFPAFTVLSVVTYDGLLEGVTIPESIRRLNLLRADVQLDISTQQSFESTARSFVLADYTLSPSTCYMHCNILVWLVRKRSFLKLITPTLSLVVGWDRSMGGLSSKYIVWILRPHVARREEICHPSI